MFSNLTIRTSIVVHVKIESVVLKTYSIRVGRRKP